MNSKPPREFTAEGPKTAGFADLGDLVHDPENRRRHGARNVALVVDALHTIGAARSIVIDENDMILAGNATVQAAMTVGITKVQVIDTTGDTLIAVRRRGLSPEQKRALALFDNRAAELAEWDVAQLAADAAEGLDLSRFFEPVELLDLLRHDAPIPAFTAVDQSEQGRLDQLAPITCPKCGHAFPR